MKVEKMPERSCDTELEDNESAVQEEESFSEAFYRRGFRQVLDVFIKPEIKRRERLGLVTCPMEIRAAQIIFDLDKSEPEVRLNDEVRCEFRVKLKDDVKGKKLGDPVYESDIEALDDVELLEQDANAGHITFILVGNTITTRFSARYNAKKVEQIIDACPQFIESAEDDLAAGRARPFIASLFNAVELIAKAFVLQMPLPKVHKSKSHNAVRSQINRQRKYENISAEFVELYNKLFDTRNSARYVDEGGFSVDRNEAEGMLALTRKAFDELKEGAVRYARKRSGDEPSHG